MNSYLLPALEFSPKAIGRLIEAMAAEEYDRSLGDDRFTPREVVAHLADWEPIMRARIHLAVEKPGSRCEIWDEGQRAIEMNYGATDIFEQWQAWEQERTVTRQYVGSLSKEDFARTLIHPERGEQSAYDLANMLVCHDMYHVEQLSQHLAKVVVPTF